MQIESHVQAVAEALGGSVGLHTTQREWLEVLLRRLSNESIEEGRRLERRESKEL